MLKPPLPLTIFVAVVAGSFLASAPNPDRDLNSPTTLKLRATLYTIALESDFPRLLDSAFVSLTGKVLHRASKEFVTDAEVQGSGELKDGRIVMYAGTDANGAPRWKLSTHPYAIGASGCPLLPFRSISVDKRVIPLFTKLFIPETKGMELPDGTIHDGVWYALDTGSAIKRDRVDLFVGAGKAPLGVMKRQGIYHLTKLKATLLGRAADCPSNAQIASK
jgi:3D (Asp-Asp-Asp) domain-containing protein